MKINVRAWMLALVSLALLTASLSSGGNVLAATPVQNLSNGSGNPETDIQTIHITGLLSRYRDTQIGPGTREALVLMIGLCDGGILGATTATLLAPVASAAPQIAGGLAAIPCVPSPTTDGLRTGINSAIIVFSGTGARYIRTVRMYSDTDGQLFENTEMTGQVTAQYNAGTGEVIAQFGRTQEQMLRRNNGIPVTVPDGSAFPRLIYFTADIGQDATSGHVDVAAGIGAGDDTAQGPGGICATLFPGVNCGSNFMKSGPEMSSFDIVGGAAPPPSGGGGGTPPPPPPSGGGSTGGSFLAKAQALDTNHNDKVDDNEIVAASTYWTSGQAIPGTSYTISDSDIVALSTLWTTGGSISGGGGGSSGGGGGAPPPPPPGMQGLQVRAIEAQALNDGGLRLVARGQNISGLEMQIFDLSGRALFHQTTSGTTLTFRGLSADGRPLANGVYLYIATVKGMDGQTFTSAVKKLVVLR